MIPQPTPTTLFPYATLFRSASNHFESPSLRRISPTPEEYPSTYRRHARLSRAVASATEPWEVADVLRLLTDHEGYPQDSDRKSTRLNSSHVAIPYAVSCLKK